MNIRDDYYVMSKNQPDVLEKPELDIQPELELTEPNKYKVIMLNDDYTPMDFVIMLLKRYFYKDSQQAINIMLDIHQKGKGLCGIYSKDIAETKIWQVTQHASQEGHPLTCILEVV